ncbi:transcription factor 23-like [Homarus americanus]|uniref:transcription factor 23-like n=1 Tax=Homarus americanus TaxID=6706 RepID=UPI001C4502F9|nr:transcription factor 23-like [Homarus americanus]
MKKERVNGTGDRRKGGVVLHVQGCAVSLVCGCLMEGRTRRTSRSAMKGSSGSSRKSSGSRSRDFLSAVPSATEIESGELPGSGTSKNALRERTRVESLRRAYLELQAAIPSVPPNTKLSKLDVLVLATTYISHLSQLLEEDDARATHDTNNNTTNTTTKPLPQSHHAPTGTTTLEGGARRITQKGLLHPVKKWPMRARLYAGVGATEAATFLSEQPLTTTTTTTRQYRTNKIMGPAVTTLHSRGPSLHQVPPQPTLPTPVHHKSQNPAVVDYTSASMTSSGVFVDEFGGLGDKSYGYPNMCEVPQCPPGPPPPPYPAPYMDEWEGEGLWGPSLPYNDPTSCHSPCRVTQPYTAYTARWAAWHD